jgi:SNF2 family DNA or RNA helicase
MATVALRLLFHKAMVKRALVICPANVISVWDQHVRAWAGSAFLCTVVHGTDPDQRRVLWSTPAHIYVTSYSTFRNDTDEHNPVLRKEDISAFDLAILDEVHHIKNPDAQQSRAVRLLKPKYRWALSGTPLQNSVDDLKAVFRFVDPDMPLQACFSTNEIQELIRPHFLRRRKADVLPDLPDKVVQDLWVELDDDQREAYEGTLQGGREAFEGGEQPLTRMHVFTLLQKLKQICNFAPGKSKSPKLELLLDQLEEVHQAGAKAVVFSQYLSEGVDKLRGALRSTYGQDAVVEIRGQTSREQRQRAVELFQQDAHAALFLGSTRAAGEGISLTSGNYVFHFDHWWNPAVSKQAEDRVHRPGQRKNVTVYHYWAEDTIEERIYQILERKGLLYAELIDAMSEKEIDEAMKMEDWCQVLGLDVSLARKSSEEAGGGGRTITIADILGRFYGLSPDGFEELVAELFQHMGFPNARVTGGAHDGGVDVEAVRNGLGGTERIIIQCKHKRQVGVEAARELLGTVSTDKAVSKGYLVVSGKLSAGCRQFVKDHGNLAAIEAVELAKYIVQFGISISGTDDVRPTA